MVSTANEELTGLANSIRTKANITDKMTIVEMTEAVENLSIGGDNSEFLSLLTDTPTTGYTITIPEGITELKKGCFYNARYLLEVTLPETLRSIVSQSTKDLYGWT